LRDHLNGAAAITGKWLLSGVRVMLAQIAGIDGGNLARADRPERIVSIQNGGSLRVLPGLFGHSR
jgi:hypothetical protein